MQGGSKLIPSKKHVYNAGPIIRPPASPYLPSYTVFRRLSDPLPCSDQYKQDLLGGRAPLDSHRASSPSAQMVGAKPYGGHAPHSSGTGSRGSHEVSIESNAAAGSAMGEVSVQKSPGSPNRHKRLLSYPK